jgi:hypothetical protein
MHQGRASATSQRSSASSQRSSVAPPLSAHRPRAARSRTLPQLALALIGLALVAVFLVGLTAPSAALAANKKPAITSVSPASGTTAGGTTVTVSGRAFTSSGHSLVIKVTFGGKAARYHVNAHSRVICTAPAGKGTVNVFVTTKGGTTAKVSADRYAYKAPVAAPTITAFSFAGRDTAISGVIDQNAHTIAVTMPFGTSVRALVATFTTTGSAVKVGGVSQVSGVTANDFSAPVVYTVSAAGAPAQTYTVTVTVAPDSAKAITAFSFNDLDPAVTGVIDQGARTIALTVPYGADRSDLVASFTTSGASVKVGSVAQVSGTTENDFSDPVVYTVTAADASTQTYTVTRTVAANPAKAITAFSLQDLDPAVTGVIDQGARTIALTVPFGTDPSDLVASFTTSGASVKVGSVAQVSGDSSNDFSDPVVYAVTAADGSTQDYTATVRAAASPAATKYIVTANNYRPGFGSQVTISAQLANADGNAVHTSGKVVSWTSTNGGSFATLTSTTVNGVATVIYTTPNFFVIVGVTATDADELTGLVVLQSLYG